MDPPVRPYRSDANNCPVDISALQQYHRWGPGHDKP